MHMRTELWSIVGWGMVGALLWAGHAGAQGLPGCLRELGACTASLGTCQKDLATCQAEPTVIFPGDGVNGPQLSYTDNGDGTFTDKNTLLMWQKEFPVPGNYSWTNAPGGTALNGSIVTSLFELINNRCEEATSVGCTSDAQCAGVGGTGKCGLAGHRDWRLPNIRELQSLADYSRASPASNVPGANTPTHLWSGTTVASDATLAWVVAFQSGGVTVFSKDTALNVRTVRGPD